MAPVGVINGGKGVVVVRSPLRFSEPCVATEGDPIDNGVDEGVVGCAPGKGSNVVKHAIGDHLLMFRYSFVLLDSIGHYFNGIDIG